MLVELLPLLQILHQNQICITSSDLREESNHKMGQVHCSLLKGSAAGKSTRRGTMQDAQLVSAASKEGAVAGEAT